MGQEWHGCRTGWSCFTLSVGVGSLARQPCQAFFLHPMNGLP